jgi:hypothetical protein
MTDFTSSYVLSDTILESYIGGDPRAAAIALKALAATSQEWYCQKATATIDRLNYQGMKLLGTQVRQFPRKYFLSNEEIYPWGITNILVDPYGYGYVSTDVPDDILSACCEEAIALYQYYSSNDNMKRQDLQNQGVTHFSIGKLSETFGPTQSEPQTVGLHSQEAYDYIEVYLEMSPLIV